MHLYAYTYRCIVIYRHGQVFLDLYITYIYMYTYCYIQTYLCIHTYCSRLKLCWVQTLHHEVETFSKHLPLDEKQRQISTTRNEHATDEFVANGNFCLVKITWTILYHESLEMVGKIVEGVCIYSYKGKHILCLYLTHLL